jgi:hypothetical protein
MGNGSAAGSQQPEGVSTHRAGKRATKGRSRKGYVVLDRTWGRLLGARRHAGIYRVPRWQLERWLAQRTPSFESEDEHREPQPASIVTPARAKRRRHRRGVAIPRELDTTAAVAAAHVAGVEFTAEKGAEAEERVEKGAAGMARGSHRRDGEHPARRVC